MADDAPILLLAALQDEMKPVAARVGSDTRLVTLVTGIGGQRMCAALNADIARRRPGRIILIGFSGALTPALKPGDVLRPSHVIDLSNKTIILGDDAPIIGTRDTPRGASTTLLTVPYVITEASTKKGMNELHRAAAVDMESFYVAELAAEHGIPLTIVRAISDPVDFEMPAQIGSWVSADGSPRIGAVLRSLARKPSLLPTLLKLRSHTKAAAARLAQEIMRCI